MAENHKSYRKLPGRSAGLLLGANRLWYGDDHLISVSSAYGYEKYQRFYFRDIGALVIRRTRNRLLWNIAFAVIASVCIAVALVADRAMQADTTFNENVRIGLLTILGIPAAIALIGLIVNTAKGATCTFWVQTPGGMTRLESPVRVRVARKVMKIVTPLIVQAQAERQPSASVTP